MNVRVEVLSGCKYQLNGIEEVSEVVYKNIKGFEVKMMTDEEIFEDGYDETDEYGEYLIITLENGETATFRNSHVDMFREW